jgi:TetR/AcrR family transcriptional regulator, transcriptional repressor for nem operon
LTITKGEATREMILQHAAEVFNQKGYFGASMADIMQATGLEKGGIYNHFTSKDDLALQAFDYAMDVVREQYAAAIKGKFDAIERLNAVMTVFVDMTGDNPRLPGGCPALNTAVEADDAHPALRQRAQEGMREWIEFIGRILERGIERGQVRADVQPYEVASLVLAQLEGAVMLSRIFDDRSHMQRTVTHLAQYFEDSLRPKD